MCMYRLPVNLMAVVVEEDVTAMKEILVSFSVFMVGAWYGVTWVAA